MGIAPGRHKGMLVIVSWCGVCVDGQESSTPVDIAVDKGHCHCPAPSKSKVEHEALNSFQYVHAALKWRPRPRVL